MRVSWDDANRPYSDGVSNGVLYPKNTPGVAWNGLVSVTEKADDNPVAMYIDGQKAQNHIVPSVFAGTITAYTYPDEFEQYIGMISGVTAQPKSSFGFSYRDNRELHLIYNALAAPSSDQYVSIGGDISPIVFSWDFTTVPVDVYSSKATSHLVVSLDYADSAAISDLEDMVYGNDDNDPSLPDPATVLELFESHTTLRITDNGDGTWTAYGPDDVVQMIDANTFEITWPSAIFIDANSYRIYSL